MEVTESQSGVVEFSVRLAQDLKPLIRAVMGKAPVSWQTGPVLVQPSGDPG